MADSSRLESVPLERALGYSFRDRSLLDRAVTHSSRANEASVPVADVVPADNERLEFLGDAVLGWLVTDALFRRFPDFSEGQLSLVKNHLVSALHLADAAQALDLGAFLQLGRGEDAAGGRNKRRILANALEAVLGAIYLDGGAEAARAFIERFAMPGDEEIRRLAGAGQPSDARAELERIARDRGLEKPRYSLMSETGPAHAKRYVVEVRVGRGVVATGTDSSKKTAAHAAAREAAGMLASGGETKAQTR